MAAMKIFISITAITLGIAVCGCNPDHSGDVQSSVPVSQVQKSTTAVDNNPNMPQQAKDQLRNSIPPAAKGN